MLPSNVAAATLDPALVVPFAGATEARLKRVVRRQCRERRPQHTRRADKHLSHGGGQVVVGDGGDDSGEVGERRDVGREKPRRVLLGAQHGEVGPECINRIKNSHDF